MTKEQSRAIARLRELVPAHALSELGAYSLAQMQAEQFIRIFGIRQSSVDAGLICELPRLRVRVKPRMLDSGRTRRVGGKWAIEINGEDSESEQRFTLAHEFKHILDHPYIDTIYNYERSTPPSDLAERMCDYFADCLLMPASWVERAWARGPRNVFVLAAMFDVPPAAMERRVVDQLGLGQGVLRVIRGGRVIRAGAVAAPKAPAAGETSLVA